MNKISLYAENSLKLLVIILKDLIKDNQQETY